MAAAEIPDVCARLFCYSGCDYSDDHGSLLDCFTSQEAACDTYCQDEAMLALKLTRQGKSIAEVQKAVDANWGRLYPFCRSEMGCSKIEPSAKLKEYWSKRLWKPTPEEDAYLKGEIQVMPRSLAGLRSARFSQ